MNESHELGRRVRAAKARAGFFIHLAVFVAVNALLIGINLTTYLYLGSGFSGR